jgi:hypothetical protein
MLDWAEEAVDASKHEAAHNGTYAPRMYRSFVYWSPHTVRPYSPARMSKSEKAAATTRRPA